MLFKDIFIEKEVSNTFFILMQLPASSGLMLEWVSSPSFWKIYIAVTAEKISYIGKKIMIGEQ